MNSDPVNAFDYGLNDINFVGDGILRTCVLTRMLRIASTARKILLGPYNT